MVDLRAECERRGWTLEATEDADSTNFLLMNGGKLSVMELEEPEFYDLYVRCLKASSELYVVERLSPIFKLFADIDYVSAVPVTAEDWRLIAGVFQKRLCELYPDKETLDVVICTTRPKVKEDGSFHSGAHFIWPNVLVNTEYARDIRKRVIRDLRNELGNIGWEKFFDPAVYGKAGLRMPGSMKMAVCTGCPGQECSRCGGRGRYKDERVYWPTDVMDKHEQPNKDLCEKLQSDLCQAVFTTSIRSKESLPDKLPELPELPESDVDTDLDDAFKSTGKQAPIAGRIRGFKNSVCSSTATLVQAVFPEIEGLRVVNEIQLRGEARKYALIKTPCRFCMNKGACHGSNTIYFYADQKQLTHRCFSFKETNGVTCRTFRETRPIPDALRQLLFGDAKTDRPAATKRVNLDVPTPTRKRRMQKGMVPSALR